MTEFRVDDRGERTERGWRDAEGFVGPLRPGTGGRRDPLTDDFPTGPAVGEPLPPIVAATPDGTTVDVHEARAGRPAVVVFYRSAVW